MAIVIGTRPASLDGCWSTWSEKQEPNTIRTEMEQVGETKVRRRSTGIYRKANVGRNFKSDIYHDFMLWFNVASQMGVVPTRVITPYLEEEVWRFVSAPEVSWISSTVFSASCELEQLPAWRSL